MDADSAVGTLSWRRLECDTGSTTALAVVDDRSTLGAVRDVLAGRSIAHLIVKFDVDVLCHGDLILLNGEGLLGARDLGALREFASDTFALDLMSAATSLFDAPSDAYLELGTGAQVPLPRSKSSLERRGAAESPKVEIAVLSNRAKREVAPVPASSLLRVALFRCVGGAVERRRVLPTSCCSLLDSEADGH